MVTDTASTVLDRTFEAVLFDMDGTLISSIDSVVRSWTRLAIEFEIPAERFGDFHGIPARALLELLLPDRPAAERRRALQRITELEISDVDGVTVLPGAVDALTALEGTGRSAIVTSSNRALAEARVAASGLPAPGVVVTADDVARGKPAPDPFLRAADLLGVDPERCLVVEDAAAGIEAGRAAGAVTVGLTTTGHGDLGANLVVPDLAALRIVTVSGGVRVDRAG